MPKVSIEITDILEEGTCPAGHNSIYPYIRVIESGGSYPFFEEPDSHSACCPDYKRPVVFKISR